MPESLNGLVGSKIYCRRDTYSYSAKNHRRWNN